jgi:hypothetical protein
MKMRFDLKFADLPKEGSGKKSFERLRLDLRPADLVEKEGKKKAPNPARFPIILLLLLFLSSAVFCLVLMTVAVLVLNYSVEQKENIVNRFEFGRVALEREIRQ